MVCVCFDGIILEQADKSVGQKLASYLNVRPSF